MRGKHNFHKIIPGGGIQGAVSPRVTKPSSIGRAATGGARGAVGRPPMIDRNLTPTQPEYQMETEPGITPRGRLQPSVPMPLQDDPDVEWHQRQVGIVDDRAHTS